LLRVGSFSSKFEIGFFAFIIFFLVKHTQIYVISLNKKSLVVFLKF